MKFDQRLSVITIGADNLALMRDFYTRVIGWKPMTENKELVFFSLGGFLLSLCNKKFLAGFIGVHHCGMGFRGVTFGYNVPDKDSVDAYHRYLLSREVNIISAPTLADFGGYFFYFTDVEGNIIEVAYNPFIPLDGAGRILAHEDISHL